MGVKKHKEYDVIRSELEHAVLLEKKLHVDTSMFREYSEVFNAEIEKKTGVDYDAWAALGDREGFFII